jgi:hypothetical protein
MTLGELLRYEAESPTGELDILLTASLMARKESMMWGG